MGKKLPEIPKCIICGNQVLGSSGNTCKICQLKKTKDSYRKTIQAQQKMKDSNSWLKGYSPWKNIVAIPLIIVFLIMLVIAIFFIAK